MGKTPREEEKKRLNYGLSLHYFLAATQFLDVSHQRKGKRKKKEKKKGDDGITHFSLLAVRYQLKKKKRERNGPSEIR